MAGLRVLRGDNWNHGMEDGGDGHVGTVVAVGSDQTADVVWDNGNQSKCSIGKGGKYELKVFDNASVGTRHTQVNCDSCGVRGIFGMRWACKQCPNFNLCPICYVKEEHDLKHEFLRFDTPTSLGVPVTKRYTAQKVQTMGIFPEATVVRGVHWEWLNQDGGAGTQGEVLAIEGSTDSSATRNMARVKWRNGSTHLYRLGANGKVDLKFVNEFPGVYYYKDHLPNMDGSLASQSKTQFETDSLKEGDTVFIKMSAKLLEKKQKERATWTTKMADCIGKVGVIKSFTPREDAVVEFDGLRCCMFPGVLQKVPTLAEGDVVELLSDKEMAKALQQSHGEWDSQMSQLLGKCGKVVRLDKDGDVVVEFGNRNWLFNPACCVPAPGRVPDVVEYAVSSSHDDDDDDDGDSSLGSSLNLSGDFSEQVLVNLAGLMLQALGGKSKGTPDDLMHHAANGNAATVMQILKTTPELVNVRHKGLTPLVIAAHEGYADVVKILLQNGADIETPDDKGNTPLMAAIIGKEPDIAILLLDKGANVKVSNKRKSTPLHCAVEVGDVMDSVVSILVKKGCPVNAQDIDDDTALHDAIRKANNHALRVLCGSPGINLDVFNKQNFSPLQFAALRNNSFAVKTIVQRDAKTVNAPMKGGKYAALHIAANNNHIECADILIDMGKADLHLKGDGGATPLHLACTKAHFNMVKLLIEKGAEKESRDDEGNTPLHHAVAGSRNDDQEADLFGLESGSEDSDRIRIACYLMKENATYNPKNNNKHTPQDIAKNDFIRKGINFYIEKNQAFLKARPPTPKGPRKRGEQLVTSFPLALPCVVCLKQISDVTLKPCGHKIVCQRCCTSIQNCPMCEEYIEERAVDDGVVVNPNQCKLQ